MILFQHRRFPTPDYIPDGKHDGTGCCVDGETHVYEDCVVDMTPYDVEQMDEAVGITWGASAIFDRCVIRGAGKLFLCGSGDKEYRKFEEGRTVTIKNSILERFGRRGPEVQCGMVCHLEDSLVLNWGDANRFTVRNFGAWAHDGGEIYAKNTIFLNNSIPTRWQAIADHVNHFFQAIKDNGLRAVFDPLTYTAGIRRGLTASDTGYVEAYHCFGFPETLIQNHTDPMQFDEFNERLEKLLLMRQNTEDNARY